MEMKPKTGEDRRLTFLAVHRLPEHLADPGMGLSMTHANCAMIRILDLSLPSQ